MCTRRLVHLDPEADEAVPCSTCGHHSGDMANKGDEQQPSDSLCHCCNRMGPVIRIRAEDQALHILRPELQTVPRWRRLSKIVACMFASNTSLEQTEPIATASLLAVSAVRGRSVESARHKLAHFSWHMRRVPAGRSQGYHKLHIFACSRKGFATALKLIRGNIQMTFRGRQIVP